MVQAVVGFKRAVQTLKGALSGAIQGGAGPVYKHPRKIFFGMTPALLLEIVSAGRVNDFWEEALDQAPSIPVFILQPVHLEVRYYVKWYFLDDQLFVLSAHLSE